MVTAKWNKLFTAIWLIVCLSGLGYQIKRLCDAYFAYDITTNVEIQLPKEFVAPTVTVCLQYLFLVKWQQLFDRWPSMRTELAFDNLTIDQINEKMLNSNIIEKYTTETKLSHVFMVEDYFNYSLNETEVFTGCSVPDNGSFYQRPCADVFDVEVAITALSTAAKCFTFNYKNIHVFDYLALQRTLGGGSSFMSAIMFSNNVTKRLNDFSVLYDHPGQISRQGFLKDEVFEDIEYKVIGVTFSYYQTKRMPLPYVTKCRNYTTTGFTDRGHCYDSCFLNGSLNKSDQVFIGSRITQQECQSKQVISIFEMLFNTTVSDEFFELLRKCDRQCAQDDCEQHLYFPYQKFVWPRHNETVLVTQAEWLPRVVTIYGPKNDFIEFLSDLFSTFGFWLGVSVLSLFEALKEKFKRRPTGGDDQLQGRVPVYVKYTLRRLELNQQNLEQRLAFFINQNNANRRCYENTPVWSRFN